MAELAFIIDDEDRSDRSVVPVIDGEPIFTLTGRELCGMWPQSLALALLPDEGAPRRAQVLRCGCGDTGCAYLTAEIEVLAHEVVWREFDMSARTGRMPDELRFSREGYVAALRTLPPEAWAEGGHQPVFVPLTSLYFMTSRGGHGDPVKVHARFAAADREDAERRASRIAAERGLHESEWQIFEIGRESVDPVDFAMTDKYADPPEPGA